MPRRAHAEIELSEDGGVVALSGKASGGSFTLFMAPSTFGKLRRLLVDFRVRDEEEPQALPLEGADLVLGRKAS